MRAVRRIKMFTILFSLVGISFTSCISDDNNVEPNKPVKIGDAVGSYSGKAFTLQEKWMNEQNTIFKINDSLIVFDNLPVRELVGSVVKDARKTEEILNKMDKVKYDLAYTSVIDETGTALILTMSPRELKFTIPMDDSKKEVVAHVTAKYKGIYVSNRYDMVKFEWIVDKLTVDGKEDNDFIEVKYFFPGSVKR